MSVDLLKKFANFLAQQQLTEAKLLLMVSGGVDSIVLLNVATQVCDTKNLAVFHLNHNIRSDADQDALFVQQLCERQSLQFFTEKLTETPTQNQENYWREQRQTLSKKSADFFGATAILTAHHATDLVETMLFRLTKGCGLDGLSPFDISTKPFWELPKTDLLAYAEQNNLTWHEDSTNEDPAHQRNLIRHQVLPALRQITPNLEKVFVQESVLFRKSANFLTKQMSTICSHETNQLPLNEFLALPEILQQTFLRSLSTTATSLSQVNDCLRWLHGKPAGNTHKDLGSTHLVIKNQQICWE